MQKKILITRYTSQHVYKKTLIKECKLHQWCMGSRIWGRITSDQEKTPKTQTDNPMNKDSTCIGTRSIEVKTEPAP